MNTENQQAAGKHFVITLSSDQSAADVQAELNEWLEKRNKYIDTPAPKAEVKQYLDAGLISSDEADQAMEMLEAFTDTADVYQHPLMMLFTTVSNHDDDYWPTDAFLEWQRFFQRLNTFFLVPEHAAAFVAQKNDKEDLANYLPPLVELFTELAESDIAGAMIEALLYRKNGLGVTLRHHNEVMRYYGSRLEAEKAKHAAAQRPHARVSLVDKYN